MTTAQLNSVQVEGQIITYRQAGQGPALVLLHGFLCDGRVWRHQLSRLSDQFRVVAWDAPGSGMSPDPPEPFTSAAPQQLRDQFSKIASEFHPVGFRLMSLSSAEVDTRDLLRPSMCRRYCCGVMTTAVVRWMWRSSFMQQSQARNLSSSLMQDI
jgi:hypothetical protein